MPVINVKRIVKLESPFSNLQYNKWFRQESTTDIKTTE